MARRLTVFVSSTSRDLTAYRERVQYAILQLGMFPLMMEVFPAQGAAAVDACRRYMDEADIYVGILAHRYGWIPASEQGGDGENSITALEYQWAGERGLPRLCFLVDADHPWPGEPPYVDQEPGLAARLETFKRRVSSETVRAEFTTPESLATGVIAALSKAKEDLSGARPDAHDWRTPTLAPLRSRFVGRAEEVGVLAGALRAEATEPVVLRGIGGVGKTTLAHYLGLMLAEHFSGGVLWASFGPDARHPESVLAAVLPEWAAASPAGRSLPPEQLTPGRVRALLASAPGRILAVLDDVWQPEPARALLDVLPEGTACLITTRRPQYAPPGRLIELKRLSVEDACALLQDRVRVAGTDPADVADDLRAVAVKLGGHALALELAARQIVTRGAGQAGHFLARLDAHFAGENPFRRLVLGQGTTREDSLEAALALSYDPLNAERKAQFRALGVLAPDADFSAATAFAVWGVDATSENELDDAEDALAELVGAGLVSLVPGSERFVMHLLLTTYAGALARRASEYDSALGRYSQHVIHAIAAEFIALPAEEWSAWILPDREHIHHVGDAVAGYVQAIVLGETPLDTLAGPQPPVELPPVHTEARMIAALIARAMDFSAVVSRYVSERRVERGRRWLMAGLACARLVSNRALESLLLNELGLWHQYRGQLRVALAYHEARLLLTRELEDRGALSTTLNNIGILLENTGQLERALVLLEQALAIRREDGDRAGEASTLGNMSAVYHGAGQFDRALALCEEALVIRREIGDRQGEALAHTNRATLLVQMGQAEQGMMLLEQVLPVWRAAGDRAGEAAVLHGLGGVYLAAGQVARAMTSFERALALRREIGDRGGAAMTLNNMGHVLFQQGDHQRATEVFREVVGVFHEIGSVAEEAGTLFNLAYVLHHSLGQTSEASHTLQQALDLLEANQLPQDAGGGTPAKYRAFLAELRAALDG